MFDIGWSELLVIGVVAIIVVGPKELPRLMRTFGHYLGKVRHMAADFQRQFEEAVRDSEIDEVRKAMQDFHAEMSDVAPRGTVDKPLMTATPAAKPAPAATEALEAPPPAPKPKPKTRAKKTKTAPAKTAPAKTAPAKTAAPEKAPAKAAATKSKAVKPRAKRREESAS